MAVLKNKTQGNYGFKSDEEYMSTQDRHDRRQNDLDKIDSKIVAIQDKNEMLQQEFANIAHSIPAGQEDSVIEKQFDMRYENEDVLRETLKEKHGDDFDEDRFESSKKEIDMEIEKDKNAVEDEVKEKESDRSRHH